MRARDAQKVEGMSRIWPGALCEIIRSHCGNEGRRVVAIRTVAPSRVLGEVWECTPTQPLNRVRGPEDPMPDGRLAWSHPDGESLSSCEHPAAWLRPIPPDADTTPTETQIDAPVFG